MLTHVENSRVMVAVDSVRRDLLEEVGLNEGCEKELAVRRTAGVACQMEQRVHGLEGRGYSMKRGRGD